MCPSGSSGFEVSLGDFALIALLLTCSTSDSASVNSNLAKSTDAGVAVEA